MQKENHMKANTIYSTTVIETFKTSVKEAFFKIPVATVKRKLKQISFKKIRFRQKEHR